MRLANVKHKRLVIVSMIVVGLLGLLLLVVLYPLIRFAALALHDDIFPLKKKPAPYTELPTPTAPLAKGLLSFDSDRTGNFEIYTMLPSGTGVHQLTQDSRYDSWWGRISPDRRYILFYRSPRGTHDKDPTKNSLWVMDADGSHLTEIRPQHTDGWRLQGHAEWSHDGKHLVMAGGSRFSPQIYVTTVTGRDPHNLTHRKGSNIDPSWSPDDSTVYFVRCASSICTPGRQEVYSVGASGADAQVRLTHDGFADYDPYASPDGKRLAWLSQTSHSGKLGSWNIRTMTLPNGATGYVTNDHNVNSKPAWSADGRTIFFHRLVKNTGNNKFEIWAIGSDGAGLHELTTNQPGVNEYPGT